MDKKSDKELYNEYLNGKNESIEYLYNKYKNKIQYFIFNIVKDYQKAEDITQEVFIYLLQNPKKEEYDFKYYIYLVAKSRALNYINTEKRRENITQKYLSQENEKEENNILDSIEVKERKKELLESISTLDDKYKNAIYLVCIEGFSYKETATILGQTVPNIKNYVHRGKKFLKEILLEKGYGEMNKSLKVVLIIICVMIGISGIIYAATTIYKNFNENSNVTINPAFQSTLKEETINNLWIGTMDLAWKELREKIGGELELEETVEMVEELNESKFTKEMLDENDYDIEVSRTESNGYNIEASLNKNLNFIYPFDNFNNDYNYTFGDNGTEYIKYFGINNGSLEKLNENVEVLFYNNTSDKAVDNEFAISLKTKEGDEIILYRTDDNKSFLEYYEDINKKAEEYVGDKELGKADEVLIPYVNVNGIINYKELTRKEIKNTDGMYISNAIQNVNFSLNESGCNITSHATMTTQYISVGNRYFWFKDTFIIFMKEANSSMPYFSLKVDNQDILEKKEETDEPKILDPSVFTPDRYKEYLVGGEYKFYEDEEYEYYYPSQKTEIVQVYFKDGNIMTAEEALKSNLISIELLDKYGVEYIKKEKT